MRRARTLATLLHRSWEQTPPTVDLTSAEVVEVLPLALGTGAAALVWRRLAQSSAAFGEELDEIHQAYRLHALQAQLRLRSLGAILTALRDGGLDPILVKGWAVARCYPELGLRPYGDLDVVVADAELDVALRLLDREDLRAHNADVHAGTEHLTDRSYEAIRSTSRLVDAGSIQARIPSPEDHLRILCFHALYHGVWRPIWLCDLGAFLASEGATIDWPTALGEDRKRRGWIVAVLRIAERLVGADLVAAPDEVRDATIPRWLEPAVLRQWESSARWPGSTNLARAVADRPRDAIALLRDRWPDEIRSSVYCRAPFNALPRFPFQAAYALAHAGKIARQFYDSVRARRSIG